MKRILVLLLLATGLQQCSYSQTKQKPMSTEQKKHPLYSHTDSSKVAVVNDEWKKILPADVYSVAREKGTERPWSSPLEGNKEKGTYYCAVCGNALFVSDTKFESGCGWPSFYQPVSKASIIYTPDNTHGMERTEVQCGRCKSHLGHVFEDGPPPTGLRYCINGVVLDFKKAQAAEASYNKQ
ncbi:MAG: peptide-methionine (R)-S-oxide reductase [Chitinophagaceae bacterium]|nr:MAG: peptide-methionine (R)-S-oxide reductase [Chitinophagaceae bacterium]